MKNNTVMNQKHLPSYDLIKIKSVFSAVENLRRTNSARQGALDLGFTDQDVVDAIQALTSNDFYKSMPPVHAKFIAWQDVYKSYFKKERLYIKFQVNRNNELLLSFKRDLS